MLGRRSAGVVSMLRRVRVHVPRPCWGMRARRTSFGKAGAVSDTWGLCGAPSRVELQVKADAGRIPLSTRPTQEKNAPSTSWLASHAWRTAGAAARTREPAKSSILRRRTVLQISKERALVVPTGGAHRSTATRARARREPRRSPRQCEAQDGSDERGQRTAGRDVVERGFPAELDRPSVVFDEPHLTARCGDAPHAQSCRCSRASMETNALSGGGRTLPQP